MEKIEAPLLEAFVLFNEWLQKHEYRYCLIGGMAAGYWGEPRYTKDMDFTVAGEPALRRALMTHLKKEGFHYQAKGDSQIQVVQKGKLHFIADVIWADTEYQDWVVQRATMVPVFQVKVPICSPEDLIILKLIANRRQDLVDIENVLKWHAMELDRAYLKKWFAVWEIKDRFQKEFGKEYPHLLICHPMLGMEGF